MPNVSFLHCIYYRLASFFECFLMSKCLMVLVIFDSQGGCWFFAFLALEVHWIVFVTGLGLSIFMGELGELMRNMPCSLIF